MALPPAVAQVVVRLRDAVKAGAGFYEPSVRQLRVQLAAAVKDALLGDYTAVQVLRYSKKGRIDRSRLSALCFDCPMTRAICSQSLPGSVNRWLLWVRMQDQCLEQLLWKQVYYRPIEEFRRRIRHAAEAGERGREPLRKVSLEAPNVTSARPCQSTFCSC